MSVAIAKKRPTFEVRHLMWLPAVLLLAWGVLAAAGMPLVPSSKAVTTGTATVTASVALDIHLGGTCVGYSNAYGAMADNVNATLGSCTVTWGTNNGATSTLRVESARTTAGNVMFCRAADNTSACGTGGFTNVGANAASMVADQFGVLSAVTTCNQAAGSKWNNGTYNPVPDSTVSSTGDVICTQTGTTDGNYGLTFKAWPDTVTAGSYTGQAVFTVEAT
jgi:hypothetical protein